MQLMHLFYTYARAIRLPSQMGSYVNFPGIKIILQALAILIMCMYNNHDNKMIIVLCCYSCNHSKTQSYLVIK